MMSSIRDLHYSEKFGWHTGKAYLNLFNLDVEIMIMDNTPLDYAETCIEHFNNLPPQTIDSILERLVQYCDFMTSEWQTMDFYNYIVESIHQKMPDGANKQTILSHVKPNVFVIEPPQKQVPAYSIDCNCVWEPEHGAEIIINGDKVLYVGEFYGIGPWRDDKSYICDF
jgi:hypothetical protein